jgi:hypothetical protein
MKDERRPTKNAVATTDSPQDDTTVRGDRRKAA